MGFLSFLLHDGLLLQLRHRWAVRWLPNESHVGDELLVHHTSNRHNIDNAGARVAILLHRRSAYPNGQGAPQTETVADAFETEPGRVEDAVGAKGQAFHPIRLRVRPSRGLRSFDHVG